MSQEVTADDLRALVEEYVVVTRWHSDYGDAECPGNHPDVWVHIGGGVPYLDCFHEKCAADVAAVNRDLRQEFIELCGGRGIRIKPTPQEKEAEARQKHLWSIERAARLNAARKLVYDVPVESWTEASPVPPDDWPLRESWKPLLVGLFKETDLVWIGDLLQSGREFKQCFRRVREWVRECDNAPGEQFVAAPFKDNSPLLTEHPQFGLLDHTELRYIDRFDDPDEASRDCIKIERAGDRRGLLGTYFVRGSYRRKAKYIRERPYFILESDTLTRTQFGSLVRYTQKYTKLRSLVDTAGWGIHAIFDHPRYPQWTCERIDEFYAILIGLGADRKTLLRSVPTTRLPGAQRVDERFNVLGWQRLLYLDV